MRLDRVLAPPSWRVGIPSAPLARTPEVGLRHALVARDREQDVLGLHVRVDDPARAVQEVQPGEHVARNRLHHGDGDALVREVLHQVQQRRPQHLKMHANLATLRPFVLKVTRQLHNIVPRTELALRVSALRVQSVPLRLARAQQPDLVQRHLAVLSARLLHLDGNERVADPIVCTVHAPKRPRPELAHHRVPPVLQHIPPLHHPRPRADRRRGLGSRLGI
mmetsp:Transcript_65336/g.160876  ORF Transcript_65336/g.160876 Transcript_65336/m.160876 type:complete len:221 (-) Transcript_65336:212-874(-)